MSKRGINSIADVRRERLRLEVQLKLSSQQLKIRKLELENQLHVDRILFSFFKNGIDSLLGRFQDVMGQKGGEKSSEKD